MVFGVQNYPYTSKTGIKTQLQKRSDFQRHVIDAVKSGHQIVISNIFSDQYLKSWSLQQQKCVHFQSKQVQLDLDQCFIVSDMSFTSIQLQHISPLINEQCFEYLTQSQLQKYVQFIIEYCGYLGIKCITVSFIKGKQKYIREVLNKLQEKLFKAKLGVVLYVKLTQTVLWEDYVQFRKQLDHKVHIDITIQFTANLPSKNIISKWIAQKILFFNFSSDCFVMNNNGNPVLTLPFQNLTKDLFKLKSGYIFVMGTKQSQNQQFKLSLYFKYVGYLYQIMAKNSTKRQISARGLYEVLLHPLQPYADNLQSQTYSIFQYDAPKYDEYSVAILLAFQQLKITNRNVVVYYLGSGRGALIPGIVAASKATKKKVTIYAVQKNPFPLQSLKRRIKQNKWSNIVKIVKSDIKQLKFQQKPDIFFSELLGGFGDNQLSPECLKWAENKISKEDRQSLICIPQKYSSFIKPVNYPSIHRSLSKEQKQGYFTVNFGWHYSPFKSEKVWQFIHPLPQHDNIALNRQSLTQFIIPENIIIHGFLASFDCNLYSSSYFSIVPQTQTIDMYSWFPIYFAFFEEEYLQKGQILSIQIDRVYTEKKVWYQWSYSILKENKQEVKKSKVHNQNGCEKCIYL